MSEWTRSGRLGLDWSDQVGRVKSVQLWVDRVGSVSTRRIASVGSGLAGLGLPCQICRMGPVGSSLVGLGWVGHVWSERVCCIRFGWSVVTGVVGRVRSGRIESAMSYRVGWVRYGRIGSVGSGLVEIRIHERLGLIGTLESGWIGSGRSGWLWSDWVGRVCFVRRSERVGRARSGRIRSGEVVLV